MTAAADADASHSLPACVASAPAACRDCASASASYRGHVGICVPCTWMPGDVGGHEGRDVGCLDCKVCLSGWHGLAWLSVGLSQSAAGWAQATVLPLHQPHWKVLAANLHCSGSQAVCLCVAMHYMLHSIHALLLVPGCFLVHPGMLFVVADQHRATGRAGRTHAGNLHGLWRHARVWALSTLATP